MELWMEMGEGSVSINLIGHFYCVKSIRIRRFSGPYFPASRLNTKKYGVSLGV